MKNTAHPVRALGPRIKRAIETSRYDVAEIAARLDCTVSTVYRWIREENRPSVDDLVRLAELTDRAPGWFFGSGDPGGTSFIVIEASGRPVRRISIDPGSTIRIVIE